MTLKPSLILSINDGFDKESIWIQITKRYDEWTGKRGQSDWKMKEARKTDNDSESKRLNLYGGNLLLKVRKGNSNLPHLQSARTHLIDVI